MFENFLLIVRLICQIKTILAVLPSSDVAVACRNE